MIRKIGSGMLIVSLSIGILTFALQTQTIKATPETFSDDFSSDTSMWEYLGSAYRDPINEYIVLTEPVNDIKGVVFFKTTFVASFTAEFSYKAGGGSGADGFAMFFYKEKYSSFHHGGTLAFNDVYPDSAYKDIPGYGIEFDNWCNIANPPYEHGDPSANHIALMKDNAGNHLIHVDDPRTEDNIWHDVSITVEESSIRVLVDEDLIFEWNGIIDRTFDSLGFCSATGSATNWHLIDNFSIEIYPPPIIATIDIDPDTLKLRGKGKWITAYLELSEDYDVNNIDISTILLEDTIPVDADAPTEIDDYDEDGIPDLMVKFDRRSVIEYLTAEGIMTETTLTITGELDGVAFEGSDTIIVVAS